MLFCVEGRRLESYAVHQRLLPQRPRFNAPRLPSPGFELDSSLDQRVY